MSKIFNSFFCWHKGVFVRTSFFILISLILLWVSRRPLRNFRSHGFYRFFAFEGVVALVLINHPYWFDEPFVLRQLISWMLLFCSVGFVIHGVQLLRIVGGRGDRHDMPENLAFENTVTLVEVGLYRFIRHPMYASLLLLAWGALLKHPVPLTVALAVSTTLFLVATAKVEERENLRFFGAQYQDYCRRSKMFIPFVF
ncbi:isoprenylcysteine carboxylmethyltransferase family protein [Desulfuromonas acetoxidans]|nr:isoprenylcysteine carboxylmethyltransferase family protein [Desulfuromonas acetoxidans]NVD24545.1 isoprenylcysteine carboxylmethyltransferase family protein [Desulfuromonas acetoxidans]NVE16505.1 isoprenylcysteine carboxylmethyltransferase family protein [Desulfuromonas acetoxidans]